MVDYRSWPDDLVFPNQCVAGILRLENARRVKLHRFACIRSKFVLYVVGNVGDVRSAEQKASVPTVKHDDATVFAGTAKTSLRHENEGSGEQYNC